MKKQGLFFTYFFENSFIDPRSSGSTRRIIVWSSLRLFWTGVPERIIFLLVEIKSTACS